MASIAVIAITVILLVLSTIYRLRSIERAIAIPSYSYPLCLVAIIHYCQHNRTCPLLLVFGNELPPFGQLGIEYRPFLFVLALCLLAVASDWHGCLDWVAYNAAASATLCRVGPQNAAGCRERAGSETRLVSFRLMVVAVVSVLLMRCCAGGLAAFSLYECSHPPVMSINNMPHEGSVRAVALDREHLAHMTKVLDFPIVALACAILIVFAVRLSQARRAAVLPLTSLVFFLSAALLSLAVRANPAMLIAASVDGGYEMDHVASFANAVPMMWISAMFFISTLSDEVSLGEIVTVFFRDGNETEANRPLVTAEEGFRVCVAIVACVSLYIALFGFTTPWTGGRGSP